MRSCILRCSYRSSRVEVPWCGRGRQSTEGLRACTHRQRADIDKDATLPLPQELYHQRDCAAYLGPECEISQPLMESDTLQCPAWLVDLALQRPALSQTSETRRLRCRQYLASFPLPASCLPYPSSVSSLREPHWFQMFFAPTWLTQRKKRPTRDDCIFSKNSLCQCSTRRMRCWPDAAGSAKTACCA